MMKKWLLNLVVPAFMFGLVPFYAKEGSSFSLVSSHRFRRRTTTSLQMCICINCARVTNCAAYHFVESKHEQPHMTENPSFTPQDGSPTIHVNVRTIRNSEDRQREVERMWKEHKSETELATLNQDNVGDGVALHGEQKYDLSPAITYEYDVVKCADYVHDPGKSTRML